MECIVGEDFNMECGIYLKEENICFRGWVLEETAGDSLRMLPSKAKVHQLGSPGGSRGGPGKEEKAII